MISDRDQRAFLEFARPPAGMRLAYCVGTTFTLDFSVLVQLALATQGDSREEEKLDIADAFKKLYEFEARSIVFCQSCRIQNIPKEFFQQKKTPRQRLLSLLDSAIVAVNTGDIGGTFHPKVWLLRFDSIEDRATSIWKLMVTSRNLSEANTWEIGAELVGRKVAKSGKRNSALIDFIISLPKGKERNTKSKKILEAAINDLGSVEFSAPSQFRKCEFVAKDGAHSSLDIIDNKIYKKVIAVSPFLSKTALVNLSKIADAILITHVKDVKYLEGLPDLRKRTYLFKLDGVELHAKAYLCLRRDGNGTDVFVGSANLTRAGMQKVGKNTEAMVWLSSKQDLVADFERKFVFENKIKRKPYRWLMLLNNDDLGRSDAIHDEERKWEILEKVRAGLSAGTFVLRRIGKLQWGVKWYGEKVAIDNSIAATVIFSDGETVYKLREVLEGIINVNIRCKTPSTFILIKLSMKNVGHIEFGSVAEVIGMSRSRSDDILNEIVQQTELGMMLKTILRESAKGIVFSSESVNVGKGPHKKNGQRSSVRIDGYVEALLLSDLSSQSQRALITKTLVSYVKAGNPQARILQKFWLELESALGVVKNNAA